MIEDVFSLCFGSVEGDGALLLGEVDLSAYNVELEYTPLLTSIAYPHYYSVQLLGIQVGNTKLNVPVVGLKFCAFQVQKRCLTGFDIVLMSGSMSCFGRSPIQ